MTTYTVWIGGIADVEAVSFKEAESIYNQWIDEGYDDVIIEQDEE